MPTSAQPAQLQQMRALVARPCRTARCRVHRAAVRARPLRQNPGTIDLPAKRQVGGIYATHMRSEGHGETAAIDEAIQIGRDAHIPVEIWHLKAAGKANWGKMPQVIAQIEAARAAGVDITADTYAYTAWFNTFSAFIPPWAHDGGDANSSSVSKTPRRARASARTC